MKYQKEVFTNITLIFQFGINMLVPIFVCTFIGIFLDRIFSTSFLVIILFFLGAAAGIRNIFIFARRSNKNTSYLGSDAARNLDSINRGISQSKKEDFAEKMDRIYRENMNE